MRCFNRLGDGFDLFHPPVLVEVVEVGAIEIDLPYMWDFYGGFQDIPADKEKRRFQTIRKVQCKPIAC